MNEAAGFCENCGAGLRADAAFCEQCGRPVPSQAVQEQAEVWVMFGVDEDAQPTELKYNPSFGFKQRVKFVFE